MRTARTTVLAFVVAVAAVAAVTTGAGAVSSDFGATSGVEDASNAAEAGVQVSSVAETGAGCEYPYTATDTTDTEVTVEEEPERIVTLAPSAAQTLWEFGAAEKVVGLTDNALYLDGADEKEIVAEGMNYETETIVGLEPDVVIAPNVVSEDTVETLRSNNLTVYRFESAGSFEGIYETVSVIGSLSGECEAAEATVTDLRQRVEAIRQAVSDEERPGSMYVFFGFTAGDGTFVDDILETAGTTNVAGEAGISGYAEVNDEIIANNSDEIEWLVLNSDEASHPSGGVYEETTAMQENQTVVLNVNYLNQPAPRTVRALENLTRAVHPEAYEEAQAILATPTATPTPTASPTATPTPATSPTATATATDTAAGGPGFGLVAGVLALLAVALLGRRR